MGRWVVDRSLSSSCCRVLLFAILSLRSLFGGHENGTTPKTDNHQPVLKGQPAEKRVTHRLASLFRRQFHLDHECLLNLDSEIIPPRCHRVAIRPRKVAAAALCTQVSRRNRVVKKGLFLDRVGQLDAVVSGVVRQFSLPSSSSDCGWLVGTHRGDRSPLGGTAAGSELIHPAPFHAHPLSSFCSSSAVEAAAFPVLTHTVSVRITSNIVWVDVVIVMV